MNGNSIFPQETIEAMLGRALSEAEEQNLSLYLELAIQRLGDLLCRDLSTMEEYPATLKLLVARMFDTISAEQLSAETAKTSQGISSEKVEDYSVTYRGPGEAAKTPMEIFTSTNFALIAKYSNCGNIRNGKVTHERIFPI